MMKCLQGVGGGNLEKTLGTPSHRWTDNIIMDFKEIGWEGVGWIDLACGRDK